MDIILEVTASSTNDPYSYAALVVIAGLIIVTLITVVLLIRDWFRTTFDKRIREIPNATSDQEGQNHD